MFFVAHITAAGRPPARDTIRQRFGLLRSFFERIIEWDWDDATMRIPIFTVDVPVADDPLPRFLDDMQATRLAAAAAVAAPFERLVIELLSRTGMRAGDTFHRHPRSAVTHPFPNRRRSPESVDC